MLKFVEDITNEPEWWLKRQVLELPWAEYRPHADFTETMTDACLVELAKKAKLFEEAGMVPVIDYAAYVVKSDTLITQTLQDELKVFVEPLEKLQRLQNDWQLDIDGKALNVVDPSIWSLVYGTEVIPQRPKTMLDRLTAMVLPLRMKAFGTRSQWLPCNIDLTGEKLRTDSYINNLRPVRDAPLYSIIERLIEKSLPAWHIVFRSTDEAFKVSRFQRIKAIKYRCSVPEVCRYTCEPNNRPDGRQDDDSEATHELLFPEPSRDRDHLVKLQASHVRDKGFFKRDAQKPSPRAMVGIGVSQIQVSVKMANIHLTPEKPTSEGSQWQIEGQAIEKICATALLCYDCDNIADTLTSFRTQGNRGNLGDKLHYIYGDYQNRLGPFELADKTRPGHCKMLALFLVDPMNPIISTTIIPPQQRD
ncbi:hypothetical protein LCI18_010781 [Fusarium solani-melongenae]|uniref:Uncharacterized protein n=1 Tax=Fusarium solani subsp. cucurbitae TaxID=2747967 RepID=A0ACD3ZG72_FUSSC|nr:hypothetical protein LCI18_010781 [Fusarium solani-melongenae]